MPAQAANQSDLYITPLLKKCFFYIFQKVSENDLCSVFVYRLNTFFSSPVLQVLGHYIRRQQDPETFINEIKYIASDPDDKFFFNVTDEAALNDIVDALGDRIFTLEGG